MTITHSVLLGLSYKSHMGHQWSSGFQGSDEECHWAAWAVPETKLPSAHEQLV
jgi:hypothetical protein